MLYQVTSATGNPEADLFPISGEIVFTQGETTEEIPLTVRADDVRQVPTCDSNFASSTFPEGLVPPVLIRVIQILSFTVARECRGIHGYPRYNI